MRTSHTWSTLGLLGACLLSLSNFSSAVSLPAAADTSTTPKLTLTVAGGKATVLTVNASQAALVAFNLSQLPANYGPENIASARLRLYVGRVINPGDLKVHLVTQPWAENVAGPAPTVDPNPVASIAPAQLATKQFVIVDVTDTVRDWLKGANNYGFGILAGGATPGARVLFGSKEGPAVGFPAELEVETAGNSNSANLSIVGGGGENFIHPDALYGTIPGGLSNEIGPAGSFGFAAGRRAVVNHTGSFVWADSTDADFTSTIENQFSIRAANGFSIANDAGNAKTAPVGTYFRDNAIVAWGRVTSAGVLESNFNVASITKVGTGHYKVNFASPVLSGFTLIPVVTPEVDEAAGNVPPIGAANIRLAVTNQFASGLNFDVYIYNGSFNSVDNDFQFLVTGR